MFGVIVCKNSVNLGDEIQSIAALNQLEKNGIVPVFYYDRDVGDIYSYHDHKKISIDTDKKYHLICSAWFDGNYCQWPLASHIQPLIISFHVNETIKDKSYNWLESYQKTFTSLADPMYKDFYGNDPIGCRDPHTYQKFLAEGYNQAYVSGCLTMTLESNMEIKKREGIYLVDVHPSEIRQYVPAHILEKAQLISHVFTGDCKDEVSKYQEAQALLNLYQKAELVITSRLHACLPCLAYQTPVLFHYYNMEDVRLKGLIDTIPVIGRDNIDYGKIVNVLPAHWTDRVQNMKDAVQKWIHKE